jgi:hypothetical protein
MSFDGGDGRDPLDVKRGPPAGAALSQNHREINNTGPAYIPPSRSTQARGTIEIARLTPHRAGSMQVLAVLRRAHPEALGP